MYPGHKFLLKTAITLVVSSTILSTEIFAESAAISAARAATGQAVSNRMRSEARNTNSSENRNSRSDRDSQTGNQTANRNSNQRVIRNPSSNNRSSVTTNRNNNTSRSSFRVGFLNNSSISSNRFSYLNRNQLSSRSHFGSSYDRSRYYPIQVRGLSYYYRDGHYYSNRSGRYISTFAPIGARVSFLPSSALSISYGNNRYFRVGLTWYLGHNNYYEVIDRPPVIVERQVIVDQQTQQPEYQEEYEPSYADQQPNLVIYPANGQSENQQDKDDYECYLWSTQESNYDPTEPNQDLNNKDTYIRAMTACMESKGYAVR